MSVKVYVDVFVMFSKEGILTPKFIIWEDGRKYEIDRVVDIRRMASTKAGGVGERYLCMVHGRQVSLYYECNNKWFMERIEKNNEN